MVLKQMQLKKDLILLNYVCLMQNWMNLIVKEVRIPMVLKQMHLKKDLILLNYVRLMQNWMNSMVQVLCVLEDKNDLSLDLHLNFLIQEVESNFQEDM